MMDNMIGSQTEHTSANRTSCLKPAFPDPNSQLSTRTHIFWIYSRIKLGHKLSIPQLRLLVCDVTVMTLLILRSTRSISRR
jgi:hypothetical protein